MFEHGIHVRCMNTKPVAGLGHTQTVLWLVGQPIIRAAVEKVAFTGRGCFTAPSTSLVMSSNEPTTPNDTFDK